METVTTRQEDGTVDIQERAPAAAIPDEQRLEELYGTGIRRATLGLARFSSDTIRLRGVEPAILRFGPSIDSRRTILGGIVARRPGGTIAWRAGSEHSSVAVEGFAPLLRGPLWRLETSFHDLVGRRFLARVTREAP